MVWINLIHPLFDTFSGLYVTSDILIKTLVVEPGSAVHNRTHC